MRKLVLRLCRRHNPKNMLTSLYRDKQLHHKLQSKGMDSTANEKKQT